MISCSPHLSAGLGIPNLKSIYFYVMGFGKHHNKAITIQYLSQSLMIYRKETIMGYSLNSPAL